MSRDTSFYYSFLVLPAEQRRAIVAVWDFCRAVDDAVDEAHRTAAGGGGAAAAVGRWRRELAAAFGDGTPQTPEARALAPLVTRFGMARGPFDALIEGVEMDLGFRRYQTFAELREYCLRVASAVGLMCLDIFGARDPQAREYATHLGVALQLTNILRDVGRDLAAGRVYLPQEDLRQHGCSEDDLRREAEAAGAGVRSAAVRALLQAQARRAEEYYLRAATALPRRDARRLVAAEIMGAIYRALLRRIERADYDVFSATLRVSRPRRALIAASTYVRVALRP